MSRSKVKAIPAIPRDFVELQRVFEPTIRAKIRSMRIWTQDIEDVFQEVLLVLLRRDIIGRYHTKFALESKAVLASLSQHQVTVLKALKDGPTTRNQLATRVELPIHSVAQILNELHQEGHVETVLECSKKDDVKLNRKERQIFAAFLDRYQWSISDLSSTCYKNIPAHVQDKTSWCRNSLRKLVRNGLVEQIGRGSYGRVDHTVYGWKPKADNPLRFKRYLTLSTHNVILDYMKKTNRDALSHQIVWLPKSTEEVINFETMISFIGPTPVPEVDPTEVGEVLTQLGTRDKSTINQMTIPEFIEVPDDLDERLGRKFKMKVGDDLVAGTIVLRRSGPGETKKVLLVNDHPNKAGKARVLRTLSRVQDIPDKVVQAPIQPTHMEA